MKDIVVPIADHRNVLLGEPASPSFVCQPSLFGMLPAVNLDHKAQTGTIEVESERTDRMLPSEMKSAYLIATQRMPKTSFSVCHVAAQTLRAHRHRTCTREA